MNKETKVFSYIVFAVIVLLLIYGFADSRGYRAGILQGAVVKTVTQNKAEQKKQKTKEKQAKALREKVAEEAAAKATAKAVNTFQVVNPLQDVNIIRPDQKTSVIINPFK